MSPHDDLPADADPRLRQAAEAGDTDAMNHLGSLLETTGRMQEAMQWRLWAARGG